MRRGALLAGAGLVVLLGCRPEDTDEVAGADLLGMDADQVMIGMDHYVTRDGLLRARLLADTAFTFEDAAEIRLRGVDVKFFDETGAEISALTGRRGIYHTGSRDMEMMENIVVLDRRESRRLETEQLVYDAARDRLSSDVDFVLYRRNTIVRGTGFVSDPGLDTVEVVQPSGVSEGMAAPGMGSRRPGVADRDTTTDEDGDRGAPDTTTGAPPDSAIATDTTTVAGDTLSPEAGSTVPPRADTLPPSQTDSTPPGGANSGPAREADSPVPSEAETTSAPDTTDARQSMR